MRRLWPVVLASLAGLVGATLSASAQYAQPVPSNEPPGLYGAPGRIGANLVDANYDNRFVDACGRVGQIKTAIHALLVGNNLIVYMPENVPIDSYFGTVVCAKGTVKARNFDGFNLPTIDVGDPSQLVMIGGTGAYSAPRPQCGPGDMVENGQCVRRYRASPY